MKGGRNIIDEAYLVILSGAKGLFLLSALCLSSSVSAQSLVQILAHPTDLASEHQFVENPAVINERNELGSFAAAVIPGDDNFGGETTDETGDDVPRRREGYMLGAGYGTKVGSGTGVGFLFENVSLRRDERGTVADRYEARYLQGRFATDITKNLNVGLLVHGYMFTMQQMEFSNEVTSDGSGTVLGLGAGAIFGSGDTKFGVTWLPAMRGKAEAEGESRIITRSQIFNVQLVLPISSKGQWGFGARVRDKVEDAEFDIVHREYPEGEAPFFSGSVGWRIHTTGRWLMYIMASRDGYERGVDQREDDGSIDSSWATRLKLGLGSDQGGRESYLQVVGRAVEEDDPAGGTKRVIADIHYCGVLTVKL